MSEKSILTWSLGPGDLRFRGMKLDNFVKKPKSNGCEKTFLHGFEANKKFCGTYGVQMINCCNECKNVTFVSREKTGDSLIELRIPLGGSKEQYIHRYFFPRPLSDFLMTKKLVKKKGKSVPKAKVVEESDPGRYIRSISSTISRKDDYYLSETFWEKLYKAPT